MRNRCRHLNDEETKVLRKMNHVVELERRKHLLLTALKGISIYAHQARKFTLADREIDRIIEAFKEVSFAAGTQTG